MKKVLVSSFLFLFLMQGVSYSFDAGDVRSFLLLDAIETTIKKMDKPDADPITKALINKTKLNALKKQLELQQQELAAIEASNDNRFIKWFRKNKISSKIEDTENQIKELESQNTFGS